MRKLSIKTRLILTLSSILLISFVVTSLANYFVTRNNVRKEILTSALPLTGNNIYSEILADLMLPITISSLMANDTFLRDWTLGGERNLESIIKYLRKIHFKYDFFSAFFVSEKSHRYYHYRGVLKTIHPDDDHDVWYYDFIRSGEEYVLDVDTNQADNNMLTIFINYRVEDDEGQLLGVTGVGLEMKRVAGLLSTYQAKYDRSIYLVNSKGVVQAHSDPRYIKAVSILEQEGIRDIAGDILAPHDEPAQFDYERDGSHILLSVRYVPELDWFLIVEQDETKALATARRNLVLTLCVGLMASLFIILISVFTVNHFQNRLELMAGTDEMTGLANRRDFEIQFDHAVHRKQRLGVPISLVLLDMDNLKQINDRNGHLEGDRILKELAALLSNVVRGNDTVARWGGDEFTILVEGGLDQARMVAERIRQSLEDAECFVRSDGGRAGCPITVSMGVAEFRSGDDLDSVLARADERLYRAKSDGRNRVRAE